MKREQIGLPSEEAFGVLKIRKRQMRRGRVKGIMREKRMMPMLDITMAGQAMMRKIMASQWNL